MYYRIVTSKGCRNLTMSVEDIKRIIMSMKSKCCDLDPILIKLLKDIQPILLPYLTEIINLM